LADWARAAGWGVALDDVGADPASLALMPFLRPNVVRLDLHLVQQRPDLAVAEIMTAVTAYAEQSGAHVLAEGIETAEHEQMARSLGATLGQGWRYGHPAPLPADTGALPAAQRPLVLRPADARPVSRSPYAAARLRTPQRGAAKSLLIAVSKLLERQGRRAARPGRCARRVRARPVLHPGFGPALRAPCELDSARRRARCWHANRTGPRCSWASLPPAARCSVNGTSPWSVRTSPPPWSPATYSTTGQDAGRTFDYVLTYDREIVLVVAGSPMARTLPVTASAPASVHGAARPP